MSVYLAKEHTEEILDWSPEFNNINKYYEKYDHPLWRNYDQKGGHGGLDWLVMTAFFNAVKDKKPMPVDVYDMATYMAITVLAEESLATGNTVYFPDFTEGKWMLRAPNGNLFWAFGLNSVGNAPSVTVVFIGEGGRQRGESG